jgi:tRNA-binding protein
MIFSYNPKHIGDVLIAIKENTEGMELNVHRVGNVARIYNVETNETTGFNFFEISKLLPELEGNGQVFLDNEQVAKLNAEITVAAFSGEEIVNDTTPKFVVGYVKELTPHPDSDHLSITKTEVDNGEVLQIVCGAPNVAQGQKVVVAKVGAMMPDGMIIWPGALRGVESDGMICAARELALPNAPQEKGILVLDDTAVTGDEFSAEKYWHA